MRLLDPTYIRDRVDYSFGDDSGTGTPGGYIRLANLSNQDFAMKYLQCVQENRSFMTLFIDNIRLCRRDTMRYTACEQMYDNWKVIKRDKIVRLQEHDLLYLCSQLPAMKFVIFTAFEDTSTDEGIFAKIPDNVITIYASNAIVHGGKIIAYPYGLQRILSPSDNRFDIIREMLSIDIAPVKLMYINMGEGHHPTRAALIQHFTGMPWVTKMDRLAQYKDYYTNIKLHKFMLCPSGNADGCECHRDWETIYMRRVPIVTDTEYHRAIFEPLEIPVLYIDDLMNVTEQLLIDNDYLYQQIQTYDLNRLDIEVLYNEYIEKAKQLIV